MIKRKEIKNKNKKNKSHLIFVGSFLILVGISLIGGKCLYNYLSYKEEQNLIDDYINTPIEEIQVDETVEEQPTEKEEQKEVSYNYIAVLEIPKINLKKGLVAIDDKDNNVNKNIEILQNSNMPDVENGLLALAGHSGNAKVSYFNKLNKLKKDDLVYVYYNHIKYVYQVTSTEKQTKQGFINIEKNKNHTELLLTTCDPSDKTKQVVVMSKLIDKENY